MVPHAALRFLCISHGTLSCYLADASGGPARRRSRREPEHKDIEAFLVCWHLGWGSQATALPIRPPTHPPIHRASCWVGRGEEVASSGAVARSGGSDLQVKRVPMHRLHWYPTEGSAVAHADVAQSLGDVVGVAQLLMCFTWYRKVLLPGHLWGTSGEKSSSIRFACVSHGTVRCHISDTSGEPLG